MCWSLNVGKVAKMEYSAQKYDLTMFADVYLNLLYVTVLLCMLVIGLTEPTLLLKYISVIDILHKAV